jgi:two-component system, cell cycle response regulator DivK
MTARLVLIVEDNERNRKLERDLLRYDGFRTIETDNAEDGIRMAREQHPDLVLMDIELPGIDGVEALVRLRADPSTCDIPVIAVTASAMQQDRERIMSAGFDDYQRKPIDIREFMELVRQRSGAGRRRPA